MANTVDSERVREHNEEATPQFEKKLDELAKLVKWSKYTVFFTGAGVSTSAGVGDYRGPSGAWTLRKIHELEAKGTSRTAHEEEELKKLKLEQQREEKKATTKVSMMDALPTPTHMTQSTLIRLGIAHYVVTTNLDGIYRKAGLMQHTQLCCLHGDVYVERCTACGYDFERNFHVRQDETHVHDHKFGVCERCGSAPPAHYTGTPGKLKMKNSAWGGRMIGTRDSNCGTKDTHINFGECLDKIDWDEADKYCRKADLCIIAGTSMSLRHITHFPFLAKKVALINLQPTPDDNEADLRIWAKCDPVFEGLMSRLGILIDPIPVWKPRDAVPIDKIPACVDQYYVKKAKKLGLFYQRMQEELEFQKKNTETSNATTITTTTITSNPPSPITNILSNFGYTSTTTTTKTPPTSTDISPITFPRNLILGNTHKLKTTCDVGTGNVHRWTIYLAVEDEKLCNNSDDKDNNNDKISALESFIEHVEFKLHSTFNPSVIRVHKAPYSISRVGWGIFTVHVTVHWKPELNKEPLNLSHKLSFDSPNTFSCVKLVS